MDQRDWCGPNVTILLPAVELSESRLVSMHCHRVMTCVCVCVCVCVTVSPGSIPVAIYSLHTAVPQ